MTVQFSAAIDRRIEIDTAVIHGSNIVGVNALGLVVILVTNQLDRWDGLVGLFALVEEHFRCGVLIHLRRRRMSVDRVVGGREVVSILVLEVKLLLVACLFELVLELHLSLVELGGLPGFDLPDEELLVELGPLLQGSLLILLGVHLSRSGLLRHFDDAADFVDVPVPLVVNISIDGAVGFLVRRRAHDVGEVCLVAHGEALSGGSEQARARIGL